MIFGRKKLTEFPNFTYLPEKYFPHFFWGGGQVLPLSPPPVSYADDELLSYLLQAPVSL